MRANRPFNLCPLYATEIRPQLLASSSYQGYVRSGVKAENHYFKVIKVKVEFMKMGNRSFLLGKVHVSVLCSGCTT